MLVDLVRRGRETGERVEPPQVAVELIGPGCSPRRREGGPDTASELEVVTADAVERQQTKGLPKELQAIAYLVQPWIFQPGADSLPALAATVGEPVLLRVDPGFGHVGIGKQIEGGIESFGQRRDKDVMLKELDGRA